MCTALLCLNPALEGGVSHWTSSVAVHNAMLRRGRKVSGSFSVTLFIYSMAPSVAVCELRHAWRTLLYVPPVVLLAAVLVNGATTLPLVGPLGAVGCWSRRHPLLLLLQ